MARWPLRYRVPPERSSERTWSTGSPVVPRRQQGLDWPASCAPGCGYPSYRLVYLSFPAIPLPARLPACLHHSQGLGARVRTFPVNLGRMGGRKASWGIHMMNTKHCTTIIIAPAEHRAHYRPPTPCPLPFSSRPIGGEEWNPR